MSFFYDVFSYFNISPEEDSNLISFIPNVGVVVYGDYKICDLSAEEIVLLKKNIKVKFNGSELFIKSMSKCEVVIEGKISKISCGE